MFRSTTDWTFWHRSLDVEEGPSPRTVTDVPASGAVTDPGTGYDSHVTHCTLRPGPVYVPGNWCTSSQPGSTDRGRTSGRRRTLPGATSRSRQGRRFCFMESPPLNIGLKVASQDLRPCRSWLRGRLSRRPLPTKDERRGSCRRRTTQEWVTVPALPPLPVGPGSFENTPMTRVSIGGVEGFGWSLR